MLVSELRSELAAVARRGHVGEAVLKKAKGLGYAAIAVATWVGVG